MSKFSAHLDATQTLDAAKFATSSTPWKERIATYLIENQNKTSKEILKATDPKFDGTNYSSRKHCLDSQITYMRQDYNMVVRHENDKYILLGIIDPKTNKMTPFTSALPFIKK